MCPSASRVRSTSAAMARSHGQRSSSVSGWPLRIFSTLLAGWKTSPSLKTPSNPLGERLRDRGFARTGNAHHDQRMDRHLECSLRSCRVACSSAVDQPGGERVRVDVCRRQVVAALDLCKDRPLVRAADKKHHLPAGGEDRACHGHPRHEGCDVCSRNADDPASLIVLRCAWKKRRDMAVRADPEQHDVEQWSCRIEMIRAVEGAQVRFVGAGRRRPDRACRSARHAHFLAAPGGRERSSAPCSCCSGDRRLERTARHR